MQIHLAPTQVSRWLTLGYSKAPSCQKYTIPLKGYVWQSPEELFGEVWAHLFSICLTIRVDIQCHCYLCWPSILVMYLRRLSEKSLEHDTIAVVLATIWEWKKKFGNARELDVSMSWFSKGHLGSAKTRLICLLALEKLH